jgi:hypothetical protein
MSRIVSKTLTHAMRMQQRRIAVTANNLANAATAGYKAIQVSHEIPKEPVTEHQSGSPPMASVSSSVDFSATALIQTGERLDVAIEGDGSFVRVSDDKTFYTRNGGFALDHEGRLVTTSVDRVMGEGGKIVIRGKDVFVAPDLLQLSIVGGFCDVLGVLFLVMGFLQSIKTQHTQDRIIGDLQSLLPICAYCKKIRSEDGIWHPIEKYLEDAGAPKMTHGICPECTVKAQDEIEQFKRRQQRTERRGHRG